MRRLLLAFAVASALPSLSAAFTTGTIEDPGNHEEISHDALAKKGYDSVSGAQVVFGNVDTDAKEWTNAAAHFDNEVFAAGSARLKQRLDYVIDAMQVCDAPQARYQIGRMLHAVQDFFSHSNWVENHPVEELPDLFAMQDPDPETACDPKTHQGELTSGHFPDDKRPAPHKCVHAELNKDASYRPFFAQARAAALYATEDVLDVVDDRMRKKFPKKAAELRIRMLKESAFDEKAADSCPPPND